MIKNIFRISLMSCLAAAAGTSGAQTPSVRLPVLSFVVDDAHRLRPVIGIAGSASIGAPLNLGSDVVSAEAPATNDYVLVRTSGSGWPVVVQIRGSVVTVQATDSLVNPQQSRTSACNQPDAVSFQRNARTPECLPDSAAIDPGITIDRIALSPSGSAAALFSASERRIYAFTNLSQSPVFAGQFEVGNAGKVSAFALSDDGRTVAAGVSDGDQGSVFLIKLNQPAQLIASMPHPAVIQFLHGSNDAIIADDVQNKVYALSNGQVFTLASAEDGIAGPVGIAVSNDNQRIFVGNSKSGSVSTIGTQGTVAEPMQCHCTLTGLRPTSADSVFRLTDFTGGPVVLFDGNAATPRLVFVPKSSQF